MGVSVVSGASLIGLWSKLGQLRRMELGVPFSAVRAEHRWMGFFRSREVFVPKSI